MSLGALLVDLSKLLSEPAKNRAAILALLSDHSTLVEYEVARFFVAKTLAPDLAMRLRSTDPKVRLEAVDTTALVCSRNVAAKLLRPMVKDPDVTTRKRARAAVRKLLLPDIALKDSRFSLDQVWRKGPFTPGAYNPSGWAFGLYARKTNGALEAAALARNALPVLSGHEDLEELLGLADEKALSALLRPGTKRGSAYVEFEVPKATGGTRRIAAPRKPLRTAQRTILEKILAKVPVHDAAHGFVSGRSTVTNARAHLEASVVVKMDLVDFFPSIHYRRVVGLFESLGYPTEVAEPLAGLCTYRPTLDDGSMVWPGLVPQGAPTSPAVTNLICRRLDARLRALASKMGATYTRYADDLTFSFAEEPERRAESLEAKDGAHEPTKRSSLGRFFWWVDQICQQEGFTENTKKRRVLRRSSRQLVTGIVVNEHLAIPRRERRRFRAILANVKKNGMEAEARGNSDFEAYLHGYVAYVHMVDPALAARYATQLREATGHA